MYIQYMYTYAFIHVYIVDICIRVSIYTMYVFMYVYTNMCVYTYVHIYPYTNIYMYIYIDNAQFPINQCLLVGRKPETSPNQHTLSHVCCSMLWCVAECCSVLQYHSLPSADSLGTRGVSKASRVREW